MEKDIKKIEKKVFRIHDLKVESFSMSDLAKIKGAIGASGEFTKDTKTNSCGCQANDRT